MKILLIHGNSLSPETFKHQINSDFAKENSLTVIDLNKAVLNLTDVSPQTFLFKLRDEVVKLHQEHKFDVVVGHSFGGHLAIECSPELKGLKGLVIFGTPPLSKPPKMEEAYLPNPAVGLFFKKDLTSQEINTISEALIYNKDLDFDFEAIISQSSEIIRELTPASIGTGNYNDETLILENTKIPIAILHGDKDPMVNGDYFKTLNIPTLWRKEIQIIPDAGHCIQLEEPKIFNELLSSFIGDLN